MKTNQPLTLGRVNIWIMIFIFLILVLPLTLAITYSLTYDANGNLVTGDGKYREYNSFNKLSRIYNGSNSSGTLLEDYAYHPTEERILMKKVYYSNGTLKDTTYYISDTFVQVVNSSGKYNSTYIKDQNGYLVGQINPDGTKLYVHTNVEGSVSELTNSSRAVVERTYYEPFGDIISGGTQLRYSYEGKEADSLVGDSDFHFRKYKSEWGIFTQPDSEIQDIYEPQAFNRYVFERNNPYKYIDPTGKVAVLAIPVAAYVIAEAVLDLASIYVSIKDLEQDPHSIANYIALVLDLADVATPISYPGPSGLTYKASRKTVDKFEREVLSDFVEGEFLNQGAKFEGGLRNNYDNQLMSRDLGNEKMSGLSKYYEMSLRFQKTMKTEQIDLAQTVSPSSGGGNVGGDRGGGCNPSTQSCLPGSQGSSISNRGGSSSGGSQKQQTSAPRQNSCKNCPNQCCL